MNRDELADHIAHTIDNIDDDQFMINELYSHLETFEEAMKEVTA